MLLAAEHQLGDEADSSWGGWPAHERRGRRGVRELLDQIGNDADLPDDHYIWTRQVLARPLGGGLWGAAHSFAQQTNLVGMERGKRARSSTVGAWTVGKALASGLRAATNIDGTRPYEVQPNVGVATSLAGVHSLDLAGIDVVIEAAKVGAIRHDSGLGGPVAALHRQWSEVDAKGDGETPLDLLGEGEHLQRRQQGALGQARVLDGLLRRLEPPYRAWIRGEDDDMSELGDLREQLAELNDRPHGLDEALATGSMEKVHYWVAQSPDRERSTPWERGVDPGPFESPEFGLGAPHALFEDRLQLDGDAT